MWQTGQISSWGALEDHPLNDGLIKPQEGSFLGHPVFTGFYIWYLWPSGVPTWTFCRPWFSLHSLTPLLSLSD